MDAPSNGTAPSHDARKPAMADAQTALHAEIRDLLNCVTHAMRTPLWAVSEFARMLDEDCGARLGASDRENLSHIRSGAGRLTALVEGLTRLTLVCRQPMEPQIVDLSALAQTAADDLQAESARQAHVTVQPGLTAQADPALLRQLTGILLANAWKFTQFQSVAEIQFGWIPEQDAYFVRDNGAGFDEKLAYKLFQPFQQLHANEQFSGAGMGLALARRIVRLHNGRIWAHGRVGAGATFYFTLNEKE